MKRLLTVISLLFCAYNSFCQQKNYQCPCSKIGLDTSWASTNKVSCYLIPVKKDNSKSYEGGIFYLATVVVSSLTSTNEVPLLYLHGGPGMATIENVPKYLLSKTWKEMREKRALIFFDYRGTGFSEPRLCSGMTDSLFVFSKTNSSAKQRKDYEVALYKNCREQHLKEGIDISSFSSLQLAADADAIRKGLQITFWNVYGVSFGTTVALNMIRNHSKAIKGVILDSPFPPNAPWQDFVRPFDTCFKVLEKNIAANPILLGAFPALRNDFIQAVNRLNKTPFKIRYGSYSNYDVTGDDFAWGIWSAMLSPKTIPIVPLAIKEVANGNDSLLSKLITVFSQPNKYGKFSEAQSRAIMCYEGRPRKAEDFETSLRKHYPDFSCFISAFDEDICNVWRPDIANDKIFEPVVSNVPVLILSGEYDPVCPPLFGSITAATLSKSFHLVVPAASHAIIHTDDCIRNIALSFLLNPSIKPDKQCMGERIKINFVTDNLKKALTELKK
jgi:pimeloyl-ACP methyl ester carboxylesterase